MSDAQAHLDKISELECVCPTCEQEIDWNKMEELRMGYVRTITHGIDTEEDIEEELERGNEHNKRIIIRNNQQREYESCIRDWDSSLPYQILDGDDLSSQIDELSSKISNIRSDIERVSNENMMAERHNTRLSIIQEQTEGFEKELEEIVAALGQVEEKATHLEILKKSI